jgi:hypothetical protein
MAHTQKPDFVFRQNRRVRVTRLGGDSSVDYWQPRCAGQLVAFVLCWTGYVPRSCWAWWVPTPFSCCPFTSPPTCRRVPRHLHCALPQGCHQFLPKPFQFTAFTDHPTIHTERHKINHTKISCFTKHYWCQYTTNDKTGVRHANYTGYIRNAEKIWVWKHGNIQEQLEGY